MQEKPLKGKTSTLDVGVFSSAVGDVTLLGYDQQDRSAVAPKGWNQDQYESGYLSFKVPDPLVATTVTVCIQDSSDNGVADAFSDVVKQTCGLPSLAETFDNLVAGQSYKYHVNMNMVDRYFRFRFNSDGIDVVNYHFEVYNSKNLYVPDGDPRL